MGIVHTEMLAHSGVGPGGAFEGAAAAVADYGRHSAGLHLGGVVSRELPQFGLVAAEHGAEEVEHDLAGAGDGQRAEAAVLSSGDEIADD